MTIENLNLFENTLITAANAASKLIKNYINNGFKIDSKGPANLVTEADIASERIIVETIRKTFPDHSFLGEEKEKADLDSDNLWIIDPIDGTTNFAHGLPVVGISIAFSRKGEVLVGGVLNPFNDEFYFASKGNGAFLNKKKIKVSYAKEINEALIATGFYYGIGSKLTSSLNVIQKLIDMQCHGIRRMGAASIDLCYVARGINDAYFELKLHPWDFAAGMLLVKEAGGTIVNLKGEDLKLSDIELVATNGLLENKILDVINDC